MDDTDQILQGFLYALFSLCGLGLLVSCLRTKIHRRSEIKQSESMEDLNSVCTQDPE